MKKQIIITWEWTDAIGNPPPKDIETQLTESAEDTILMDIRLGRTSGYAQQEVFGKPYKAFYNIVRRDVDENEPTVDEIVAGEIYKLKKEYDMNTLNLMAEYQEKIDEANRNGAKTDELLKNKQFALEHDFKQKEANLERDYIQKNAQMLASFSNKEQELNAGIVFARQKLQAEQLEMIRAFEEKYPEPVERETAPPQFYQMGRDLVFGVGMTVVYYPTDDAYHLVAKVEGEVIKVDMNGESFKSLLRNAPLTAITLPEIKEMFN